MYQRGTPNWHQTGPAAGAAARKLPGAITYRGTHSAYGGWSSFCRRCTARIERGIWRLLLLRFGSATMRFGPKVSAAGYAPQQASITVLTGTFSFLATV